MSSSGLLLLSVIGVTSLFGNACGHAPAAPPQTQEKREPQVILTVHGGVEQKVTVELARSDPERTHGLMFRQSLSSGRGMLFLFPQSEPLKFWMKNTYIPLDMIFIDEKFRVVFVEENAEPLTLSSRGPDENSRYVLEVPGGWSRPHGVEPGVVVRFVNVD